MQIEKKIGWQKFEDMIESQMTSPIIDTIYKLLYNSAVPSDELTEEEMEMMDAMGIDEMPIQPAMPLDQKTLDNISMANNFDCWLGHTNFDITQNTMDTLNEMEGVEVLKIVSRYRFFIGIGKMFDFKEVRQNIESSLIKEPRVE